MVNWNFKDLQTSQKFKLISSAIDRAGVGVAVTDPTLDDNPIIYVNKGFEELTGYAASEIIGNRGDMNIFSVLLVWWFLFL